MNPDRPPEDSADDLFEDAPCGFVSTLADGTIVKVNRTFERWTGFRREELLAGRRFQELLSPGGQIYHETHYAPLLQMQGSVREIAVEIVRADNSRLPALVNSVLQRDSRGGATMIRTTVFDATDRRRYEQELLAGRRREQEIAQQLQRSMLSGTLPQAPGLDIEVVYRPAVSGLEVGGDWYDAFWLEQNETVALVVGDVVGRGLEAAATMGQLRSAVRALAGTGLGPARLLTALDDFVRRHDVGHTTTVVYAELTLGSGELRYACAGHPPPLLLDAEHEPCFAWEGRSTPLAAFDEPRGSRAEATCLVRSGGGLLLYTDGLVDTRSRPSEDGMERLLAEMTDRRHEPPGMLGNGLVYALRDAEHADDVCLLAVRLS